MSTSPTYFIGYDTLEAWAEAADLSLPVYATLVESTQSTDRRYGLAWREVQIRVFQVRDGLAHYVLMTVGGWMTTGGKTLDEQKEQAQRRAAESAWKHVQEWLYTHGFDVHQGTVAVPNNLRLLNGAALFLEYDREKGEYVRA